MASDTVGFVLGVDASRIRSGGGIRHIVGLLSAADPREFGIKRVHVWSYEKLIGALPQTEWMRVHSPRALEGSLARQLWWQYKTLPNEARAEGIDMMFNIDAGSVYPAHPSVTMSQDLLEFEPGELDRYRYSRAWLRLIALRFVQTKSLGDADAAIFPTRYVAAAVQRRTGPLEHQAIIPLGVDAAFVRDSPPRSRSGQAIKCIYVSQTDLYKHQWHVVRAVANLRRRGHDVTLLLVGGGAGRPQQLLDEEIRRSDPDGKFVAQRGFVPPDELPAMLTDFDIFVFASSCETMSVTLLEGMAAGLPIACSDRGPMPEILGNGGVYFDPEIPASIASAIEELIVDPSLRTSLASRSAERARDFTWERCARDTWRFLAATHARLTRNVGDSRRGPALKT